MKDKRKENGSDLARDQHRSQQNVFFYKLFNQKKLTEQERFQRIERIGTFIAWIVIAFAVFYFFIFHLLIRGN